jgi:hypothetical protein
MTNTAAREALDDGVEPGETTTEGGRFSPSGYMVISDVELDAIVEAKVEAKAKGCRGEEL